MSAPARNVVSLDEARRQRVERMVLSSLLGDAKRFERALEMGLGAHLFMDPACRLAYQALQEHFSAHAGSVPGVGYLEERAIPFKVIETVDDIDSLLTRLQDFQIQLELEQTKQAITRLQVAEPRKALELAHKQIAEISDHYTQLRRVPTKEELSQMVLDEYWLRKAHKGLIGLPYPFPSMNEETGGILVRTLVVVYGPSKNYKSTLVFLLAVHLAQLGFRVYFASGELKREDQAGILLCMFASVDLEKYRKGILDADSEIRLVAQKPVFDKLPLEIGPVPGPGIQELDLVARRAANFGAEIVILDGAHKLPKSREWQDVGAYADRVVYHALNGPGFPWVAVAQSNRMTRKLVRGGDFDPADVDQDIGGSVAWLQHCSQAIRIRKIEDGIAEIDIGANRYGRSITVPIWMIPGVRMEERGPSYDADLLAAEDQER